MKKYIAYYRVSTKKQGLGLDAQRTMVKNYIAANGGEVLAEFSEKESAKSMENREELQAALAAVKSSDAILLVAKLDRLSRDVADTFTLAKSIKFEVCDMNATDTFTLGIMATLAQKERELISERTKSAMAERKAQGMKFGNPNFVKRTKKGKEQWHKNGVELAAKKKAAALANDANKKAAALVKHMVGASLRAKAAALNEAGFTTPRGKAWNAEGVRRLEARFGGAQ